MKAVRTSSSLLYSLLPLPSSPLSRSGSVLARTSVHSSGHYCPTAVRGLADRAAARVNMDSVMPDYGSWSNEDLVRRVTELEAQLKRQNER